MTRSELLPLEGQWVRWRGIVETWQQRPGGELDICIRSVKLWPWTFSDPLETSKPAQRTEHLWLRCPAEFVATLQVERLQPANGIGTVGWYRRSDGTTDLGVKARVLTNAGQLQTLIMDHVRHGEWQQTIDLIDRYIARHRDGSSILCAPNMSPEQILTDLNWSRQLAVANLAKLATAPRRTGRCRSAGRFTDLLRALP